MKNYEKLFRLIYLLVFDFDLNEVKYMLSIEGCVISSYVRKL